LEAHHQRIKNKILNEFIKLDTEPRETFLEEERNLRQKIEKQYKYAEIVYERNLVKITIKCCFLSICKTSLKFAHLKQNKKMLAVFRKNGSIQINVLVLICIGWYWFVWCLPFMQVIFLMCW